LNDLSRLTSSKVKKPLHDPSSESFDGELSPDQMLQQLLLFNQAQLKCPLSAQLK
jgi:hypothetical protein